MSFEAEETRMRSSVEALKTSNKQSDAGVARWQGDAHSSFNESIDFAPDNDTLTDLLFTPPAHMRKPVKASEEDSSSEVDSEWDVDISPILKHRESDDGGGMLFVSSGDPTASPPLKFCRNEGIVDYSNCRKAGSVVQKKESSVQDDEKTLQNENIADLRRNLDRTSSNLKEKIAEAARRRKAAMTRSRDSLVAKEQELLRVKAEFEANRQREMHSHSQDAERNADKPSGAIVKPFKAKPMPSTTGSVGKAGVNGVPKVAKRPTTTPLSPQLGSSTAGFRGTAGVRGVPKVEKRPTTTPLSPLLGSRRPQKPKVQALEPRVKVPDSSTVRSRRQGAVGTYCAPATDTTKPFRARPLPSSLDAKGHGGRAGVPKVPKRPLTVPQSPYLGPRRRAKSAERGQSIEQSPPSQTHVRPLRRSASGSSLPRNDTFSGAESPILFGLKLLVDTPDAKSRNQCNDENQAPQDSQSKPFELHSTRRAKMRAEFNVTRNDNMLSREAKARIDREKQIKQMRKELKVMGRML